MAANQKLYQRLPGTGHRSIVAGWLLIPLFFVIGIFVLLLRGNRIQLWQGEEHLLLVEWNGYKEKYKRFNYRDIQAVVIQKTSEALAANIVLTFLVALILAPALAIHETGLKIFLLSLAGLFGLILAINALSGPTCRCFLRTAVQTEELPSLSRVKRAQKVFARLQPLITAAQGGQIPAEMISAQMRDLAQFSAAENPNIPPRLTS
jgi:hypothetical protein